MNERPQYRLHGLFASTAGIFVLAAPFPLAHTADAQQPCAPYGIKIVATADTHQSSTIKPGLLQEHVSTLISERATVAVGAAGLKRLESFLQLRPGWDGNHSKPVDLQSVETFSNFFSSTGLRPNKLGVFMSAQGNVVVNWPDQNGSLVELEFQPSGVEYFIEKTGDEDLVTSDGVGFHKLATKLSDVVVV